MILPSLNNLYPTVNEAKATNKFHKLVDLKNTPPLKKTSTMPIPNKIHPKLLASLRKNTNVNAPAIIANTATVAGNLLEKGI
ncbi:hypothetical protein [Nostoc sp.]|uniref:hypothetical protein n=1 Tax=Nostoc sp. TaxID=1180 RepID=UPI003FA606F8